MDRATSSACSTRSSPRSRPGAGTGPRPLDRLRDRHSRPAARCSSYSEPGRGTTFKVYLPRIWERAAEREAEQAALGARAGGGTETVLLVEDEDIVRNLVREMLQADGYTVLAAAGGEEALELARTLRGRDRPADDGRRHARDERPRSSPSGSSRSGPSVRVVFTSGYAEDAIANHGVLRPGRRSSRSRSPRPSWPARCGSPRRRARGVALNRGQTPHMSLQQTNVSSRFQTGLAGDVRPPADRVRSSCAPSEAHPGRRRRLPRHLPRGRPRPDVPRLRPTASLWVALLREDARALRAGTRSSTAR